MSIYKFDPSESCYHFAHQKIDEKIKEQIMQLYQKETDKYNCIESLRISLRDKALQKKDIRQTIKLLEEFCMILTNDPVIGDTFNTALDILLLAFFWKKAGNKKTLNNSDIVTILCKLSFDIYSKSEYRHLYKKINEIDILLRWT